MSVKDQLSLTVPPTAILRQILVAFLVVGLFTSGGIVAAAEDSEVDQEQINQGTSDLKDRLNQFGNIIIIALVAVAIPNGAYGFLEWMTAGSSVEKDERGRKRIRNTFIALAGAAVIKAAVEAVSALIPAA